MNISESTGLNQLNIHRVIVPTFPTMNHSRGGCESPPKTKKSNKTHKTLKPWISNTTPMVLFQNMEITHAAARLHRVAGKE